MSGQSASSTQQRPWTLVAAREIRVRLTDRNFLITTGFTLVLLIGVFAVQALVASLASAEKYTVAVVDERAASRVVGQAGQALRIDLDDPQSAIAEQAVSDADAGRRAVAAEEADALLVQREGGWALGAEGGPDPRLEQAVAAAVRADALAANAAQAGTTVAALETGASLTLVDLASDGLDPGVLRIAGLGFGMIFYLAPLLFGLGIAQSVVEEKQSRIVEILAAAIPVPQLLAGKVLGNTVLAIGQMLLLVGVALLGLTFTPYDTLVPLLAEPVLWYLPFFVVGFVALACIWAGVGSLASRGEDLQTTTMPITLLLVAVFITATNLSGLAQQIGSFVPVMSTILMPLRLLEGGVGWWEPVLALALTLAFSWLTIRLGAMLYRRALLQTGGRLGWRAALRLEG